MARLLQTIGHLLPYHLFAYGTLLGTQIYQTFVNTKLCFQYLPMREFLALQKRVFPVYFASQVGLVVLTAATYPPYSIFSLVNDLWSAGPLLVVLGTGGLNWVVYGPRTTTASFVRKAVHDAKEKQQSDQGDEVDEGKVQRADKAFKFNHAMSIHLNAISLVATVWYGFTLSSYLLGGV